MLGTMNELRYLILTSSYVVHLEYDFIESNHVGNFVLHSAMLLVWCYLNS